MHMCSVWMCVCMCVCGGVHSNHARVCRGQRLTSGIGLCHSLPYILRLAPSLTWCSPISETGWPALWGSFSAHPGLASHSRSYLLIYVRVQAQTRLLVLRGFSLVPTRLLTARLKLCFKGFLIQDTYTRPHTSCEIVMAEYSRTNHAVCSAAGCRSWAACDLSGTQANRDFIWAWAPAGTTAMWQGSKPQES